MGLEYYSFDKVLNELSMDEDELKRLVSEGQIRAFRDDNRMKFRKDDIEALRKGKQTEPTIILPDSDLEPGDDADLQVVDDTHDETLLDLDGIEVEGDFQTDDSSVPSLDLEADLGDDTLTEELVFDEEEDLGEEATQAIDADAGLDDDFGMQTEPLSLEEHDLDDDEIEETELDDPDATFVGDSDLDDFDDDEEEEDDDADATFVKPEPKRRAAPARRAATAAAPKAQPEKAEAPAHTAPPIGMIWVVVLAFIALFYTLGTVTMYDYARGANSPIGSFTGNFVSETFFNDVELGHPDYRPRAADETPEFLTGGGS